MISVWDVFLGHCRQDKNAIAVHDDRGRTWSRADLSQQADRVGDHLKGLGVGPGDAVLICMPNRVDWMAAYLGTLSLGAVPGTVPVTHDATAIAASMRQIGAATLLISTRHRSRDFAAELPAIAHELGSELRAILFDDESGDVSEARIGGESSKAVGLPQGTVHILFSSSTTGEPKAIAHSEESLTAYNIGIIDRYGVTGADTIFMPSPLGHSTGVWHGVRMSLLTGAALIIQDTWDPVRALQIVEEHRARVTVAATPFLKDLVECPWEGAVKLRHLRTFLCGGAQVPPNSCHRRPRNYLQPS
jgi:acyl-coenzyme A synthetase/AMP-(fatty) acid ligase